MKNLIQAVLNNGDEKTAFKKLIDRLQAANKRYSLRNEILPAFADYCHESQKPAYFSIPLRLGNCCTTPTS